MGRFIVMKYRSLILLIHLINAQPNVDLDLFIVGRMNSGYIPGLSACAIINDQVVWTNSYGFANITLNIPVSDDNNFLLASISKLVTTTAIIQIVENITNQTFEEYCDINIFNPLGMVETSWHFDDMNELNVAMPYEWMSGWEELGHYFIPYYPSAQLRSNVNELCYFLIAYMGYMPGSLNEELLRVY